MIQRMAPGPNAVHPLVQQKAETQYAMTHILKDAAEKEGTAHPSPAAIKDASMLSRRGYNSERGSNIMKNEAEVAETLMPPLKEYEAPIFKTRLGPLSKHALLTHAGAAGAGVLGAQALGEAALGPLLGHMPAALAGAAGGIGAGYAATKASYPFRSAFHELAGQPWRQQTIDPYALSPQNLAAGLMRGGAEAYQLVPDEK
jgi:hypothetical protein